MKTASPRRSLSRLLLVHETAFLFLVAITGLLSGLSAYFWQKTSTESIRITNSIYLSEQIRGELYRQLQEVARARSLDGAAKDVYYEHSKRIGRHFNQLRRAALSREEDQAIQALQQAYREIQSDMHAVINEPRRGYADLRLEIINLRNAEQMFNRFEENYQEFKALYSGGRQELERTIELWTRYAPVLIPILFLLAVVIVIYTSRVIRGGVVRPLANIMSGAVEISRGNLDHKIPERGVNEVAELAGSINRMAGELQTSRDALVENERQAALGSLVPMVAHNIRNPLASIRAAAQVLEETAGREELKESRDAIVATTDRLGRWVNALVSYLHPLKPRLKNVRAAELVDAALALLQEKIAEKEMTVKWENRNAPAVLAADPDLMEQAMYALLANAVEASPQDSELWVSIAEREDAVIIGIRDQGPGLPFQPEPGNLEPGPSTKRFGTGLGIPIAFKICQGHGWRLSFDVLEGNGTMATIVAPRNNPENSP